MKTTLSDWCKVALLLLDEAAVIGALFLILHVTGVGIPGEIVIVFSVLAGIVVLVLHIKIIPSFHLKRVTGREGMIGEQGRAETRLSGTGTVIIRGERWQARSMSGSIEADENIEVTAVNGLKLTVRSVDEDNEHGRG